MLTPHARSCPSPPGGTIIHDERAPPPSPSIPHRPPPSGLMHPSSYHHCPSPSQQHRRFVPATASLDNHNCGKSRRSQIRPDKKLAAHWATVHAAWFKQQPRARCTLIRSRCHGPPYLQWVRGMEAHRPWVLLLHRAVGVQPPVSPRRRRQDELSWMGLRMHPVLEETQVVAQPQSEHAHNGRSHRRAWPLPRLGGAPDR